MEYVLLLLNQVPLRVPMDIEPTLGNLCPRCEASLKDLTLQPGQLIPSLTLHSSLESLRETAKQGCGLCNLILHTFFRPRTASKFPRGTVDNYFTSPVLETVNIYIGQSSKDVQELSTSESEVIPLMIGMKWGKDDSQAIYADADIVISYFVRTRRDFTPSDFVRG